jgi:hypothetical protein
MNPRYPRRFGEEERVSREGYQEGWGAAHYYDSE